MDQGSTRDRRREDHGDLIEDSEVLRIDCATCVAQATVACDDCLVTYLCRPHGNTTGGADAVVVDVAEARALRVLQGAGLVPGLRHRPRSDGRRTG